MKRFSIRALAIIVTLVCGYFGAWEATKRIGLRSMKSDPIRGQFRILAAYSPGPCLISCFAEQRPDQPPDDEYTLGGTYLVFQTHYLWLFGPAVKLPFQSLVESPIYSADGEFVVPRS